MGLLSNCLSGVTALVGRVLGVGVLASACVVGAVGGVVSTPRPALAQAEAAAPYDYFVVQKAIWTALFNTPWFEDAEYALDRRVDAAGLYQGVNEAGEPFTFTAVGSLKVDIDALDITPAERAWAHANQVTFAAVFGVLKTDKGVVPVHGLAATAVTPDDGFQSRLLINNVIPEDSAVLMLGFGERAASAAPDEIIPDKAVGPPTVDPACALRCTRDYEAALAAADQAWRDAMNAANQQYQDAVNFAMTDFNLCIAEAAARYTARALRCMIPRIRIWKIGRCLENAATDYANEVTICTVTLENRLAAALRALNQQITAINNARQRARQAAWERLQACLNGCVVVPGNR